MLKLTIIQNLSTKTAVHNRAVTSGGGGAAQQQLHRLAALDHKAGDQHVGPGAHAGPGQMLPR